MNEQVKAILNENILGVLATVNEDGSPRATPLHIVADENSLYWLSATDRVHSVNIARDGLASVALFSPDISHGPKGVYVDGQAELLDDLGQAKVLGLLEKRLGKVPPIFASWSAYRLSIGTLNEQKSTGNCWYFYS